MGIQGTMRAVELLVCLSVDLSVLQLGAHATSGSVLQMAISGARAGGMSGPWDGEEWDNECDVVAQRIAHALDPLAAWLSGGASEPATGAAAESVAAGRSEARRLFDGGTFDGRLLAPDDEAPVEEGVES